MSPGYSQAVDNVDRAFSFLSTLLRRRGGFEALGGACFSVLTVKLSRMSIRVRVIRDREGFFLLFYRCLSSPRARVSTFSTARKRRPMSDQRFKTSVDIWAPAAAASAAVPHRGELLEERIDAKDSATEDAA
jgi:hypothetical protein